MFFIADVRLKKGTPLWCEWQTKKPKFFIFGQQFGAIPPSSAIFQNEKKRFIKQIDSFTSNIVFEQQRFVWVVWVAQGFVKSDGKKRMKTNH